MYGLELEKLNTRSQAELTGTEARLARQITTSEKAERI